MTLAERNANAALRYIPAWLVDYMKLLFEAGNTFSNIYSFLAEKCRNKDCEITFTLADVKNALGGNRQEKSLDTTLLFKYLVYRQKDEANLGFALDQDDKQKLNLFFFVFKGGLELWSSMGSRLILYDTKHGTNRYGLKLGLFVSVDENGKTRMLAASFVQQEDAASFEWVFTKFNEFMRNVPVVVKKVWGTSIKHFLCTYHISKNFHQYIKP
ncbi:MAG: hypothetical protein ACREOZ_01935, partial [Gloeomargaritales cyanobacterium]